jgi:aminoglycoside phosphotransferase family enzyme
VSSEDEDILNSLVDSVDIKCMKHELKKTRNVKKISYLELLHIHLIELTSKEFKAKRISETVYREIQKISDNTTLPKVDAINATIEKLIKKSNFIKKPRLYNGMDLSNISEEHIKKLSQSLVDYTNLFSEMSKLEEETESKKLKDEIKTNYFIVSVEFCNALHHIGLSINGEDVDSNIQKAIGHLKRAYYDMQKAIDLSSDVTIEILSRRLEQFYNVGK